MGDIQSKTDQHPHNFLESSPLVKMPNMTIQTLCWCRRQESLDHITVPEMLETMHENDLFDMFPVFSNVVHILGVIPATLCDCVLQNDHSLRCQGRSQLFD